MSSRGSSLPNGPIGATSSGRTAVRTSGSRDRGSQPAIGSAAQRPERPYGYGGYNYYSYYDLFSPWGRWYPWYAGGWGYNGYVTFDPWRYGNSRYSLWRYGSWYNPYSPYCVGAGYWPCEVYATGGGTSGGGSESTEVGSLRLRVSPSHAQVYVDGALVGIVDDFNGLSNHLDLPLGEHLVEIKADGYETLVPEFEVKAGKTTTIRGSLKKIGK